MGKTTNILDLNNRLTKVEKENVAQNSYTSLKNKPKINSVTLTGNKTLADIGAAAAADVGDLSSATTTDKSSVVAMVNELVSNKCNNLTTEWFSVAGKSMQPNITSDYEIDITKSGYTALSVAGFYVGGGGGSAVVSANISGETSAKVRIVNTGTTAVTPNDINISILYSKN